MFKKISILMFALLMIALLSANVAEAQKASKYPLVSISPLGGVQFPMGNLTDSYDASFNAGLEFALRLNRETALFLNGTYYNMPIKDDAIGADAYYIAITAGPRYVFTSPKIKAQFFLEAGAGVYIFNRGDYTINAVTIPSETTTNFGVNVGPGVLIPLGKVADLIMKTKFHYTFGDEPTGGSRTFLGVVLGVDFKL
ncbi:MAG: hypothetical protein JW917_04130 [Ignavibacteria bacterium]|nr:hypothetical protein [Ignavibacteria bacterium]